MVLLLPLPVGFQGLVGGLDSPVRVASLRTVVSATEGRWGEGRGLGENRKFGCVGRSFLGRQELKRVLLPLLLPRPVLVVAVVPAQPDRGPEGDGSDGSVRGQRAGVAPRTGPGTVQEWRQVETRQPPTRRYVPHEDLLDPSPPVCRR